MPQPSSDTGEGRVAARRNDFIARPWCEEVDLGASDDDLGAPLVTVFGTLVDDVAVPGNRLDRVANQVVDGPRQLRLRSPDAERGRAELRQYVGARLPLAHEPQGAVGPARLHHLIDVEVLLGRSPLTSEREEVLDGLGSAEGGHLDRLDIGAQLALGQRLSRWLAELGEDDVRQSDQRPESIVEIVRDAARQDAQRLHSLRGSQSFLDAAFVQHARLNELLPQANALERRRDLVAKRLIAVVPIGIAERDDTQQLILERQRQDEEALPSLVGQRARRHQLAGGVVPVVALHSSPSRRHIAERNASRASPATQAR